MNKPSKRLLTLTISVSLLYSLFVQFTPPVQAAIETITVTAIRETTPGFYWCQHLDGHWSTVDSQGNAYSASNDGGKPAKSRVQMIASATQPPDGWKDEFDNNVNVSDVRNAIPIGVVFGDLIDPNMQASATIQDGKVLVTGYSGNSVIGSVSNACGASPGMVYLFPIKVTWQGTITRTTIDDELMGLTINPLQKTLNVGGTQQFIVNATWKRNGVTSSEAVPNAKLVWSSTQSSKASVNSSGVVTGLQGTTTPAGITASYTEQGESVSASVTVNQPVNSITGDFDILPSNSINYHDPFTLKPKNIVIPSACTYMFHEFQISRDGNVWTSPKITNKTTTTSFSSSTYPFVVGVGSHTITIRITADCADSGWVSSKALTVNGPSNNDPPDFQLGWTLPGQPSQIKTTVVVGTRLDLIYLEDSIIDPNGDDVFWDGFDFTSSAAWAQTIPHTYSEVTEGYKNILMDTIGYFTVRGTMRDQFGATTTKSTSIQVASQNPIAVITGSAEVVEGRTLSTPLSSTTSYSPVGRSINHTLDSWTNKKPTYLSVGTEVITLDVFDSSGLKSSQPATHTITVKPDLPPIPKLYYIPTALRGSQIVFTNASYSPDGDTITSNMVSYRCDTNNDGLYTEPATSKTMDANKQFTYTPTTVGVCQFRVTVSENYGKQATGNFILTTTNDNPEATFTLSGVTTQPNFNPTVSVSPATLMGSSWTNTNMLSTLIPKRWVLSASGESIVATTDRERFSSISTNVLPDTSFTYHGMRSCNNGFCAPNSDLNSFDYYLGGGTMPGYSQSGYVDEGIYTSAWRDAKGNVYGWLKKPTTNYPPPRDLVRMNGITGQVDWRINYENSANPYTTDIYGDGTYIIVENTTQSHTNSVVIRNADTGAVVRQKSINTYDFDVLGIYNKMIIIKSSNSLFAYDYNFNLIWSTPSLNNHLTGKFEISKDGYLLYLTKMFHPGGSTHDPQYDISLKMINLNTGVIQSSDIFVERISEHDSIVVTTMSLIDDATLYIAYTYMDYGGTTWYSTTYPTRLIKTTPMVADTVLANEAFASGQITSPLSTSHSNGEYQYDLRFNSLLALKPAGFGFRIQDNKNMYRVEVFESSIALVKYVNAVRTIIASSTYPSGETDFISYTIKAVGNNIRVYTAGTPIIDSTDTQFATGRFGPYSAMQKAEIKNVRYKILDSGGTSTTSNNISLVDIDVQMTKTFTDRENDPRADSLTAWRYEHSWPNKFLDAGDGKSGLSSKHNQVVNSPYLNFDRVGVYRITYSAWDDPHPLYVYPSTTFATYRKQSNPHANSIVVHRKPVSIFTVSIKPDHTVGWVDDSYDPDRWLSPATYSTESTGINYRLTRGILEKKFQYLSPSGITKSVQLVTPTESGIYTVGMAVKDEYGAWSDWAERQVHVVSPVVVDNPPTAGFTLSPATVYRGTEIMIDSTANDVEDGSRTNLVHEYYVRKDSGSEVIVSGSRTSWTHVFAEIGSFSIRQVVSDAKGQTDQSIRIVTVLNRKPSASITSPSSTDQNTPTLFTELKPTFNWTYMDADNDAQTRYQIKIYRYGGHLLLDSGVIYSSAKVWVPSVDLPESQYMYAIVTVHDGIEWSVNSAARYFYINTNSPPMAEFAWSPKPVWEGDKITIIDESTDPDGNSLTKLWTISRPDGMSYTSAAAQPTIISVVGTYSVTLVVSDGNAQSSVTHLIRVEPLVLEANVSHTELWLAHHIGQGHETVMHPKDYYTGEIMVVDAVGSLAATSSVTASLDAIGLDGNPIAISVELAVTDQANHYQANLYDPILSSLTGGLPDGQHLIRFVLRYTNGVVRESSIPIRIIGHVQGAVNVHRRH